MKNCNQCGKCCEKYGGQGLSVTREEIEWWQDHRPEIALYVKDGAVWFDPVSKAPLDQCPWLDYEAGKATCQIYFDRPDDCRQYPSLVDEMIRDECEMIEVQDLLDLAGAKKRLLQFRD